MTEEVKNDPEWDLPRKPMGFWGLVVWVLTVVVVFMTAKSLFF